MAANPGKQPFEMVKCDDCHCSNWLEDIFDAADEGMLTSPETSVLTATMAALEADGRVAERVLGSKEKRGWGEEDEGRNSSKKKKSRREKLRREELNDKFMLLSAQIDPEGILKTDRATIVTEAVEVIKRLREELVKMSSTVLNINADLEKQKSSLADLGADKAALQQEKAKLEHQLYCFMSRMPFASPLPMAMPMPSHLSAKNGGAVKPAENQTEGGMMPVICNLPRLVVQSTTAEEDAQLHAPCA